MKKQKRSDWFEGAAFAYEDCGNLIDLLTDSLPPELAFAKPGLNSISAAFREKISNMDLLLIQKAGFA